MGVLKTATTYITHYCGKFPDYRKRTHSVFERGNWLIETDSVEPQLPKPHALETMHGQKNRSGVSNMDGKQENPLHGHGTLSIGWQQIYGRG